MLQVCAMKLTESTNICHFSDRLATTIKVNIKGIFMGNDVFLKMFIWWMDYSLRIKYLVLDKIQYFVGDRLIPATLLSKVDDVKFVNPSWPYIWIFCHLIIFFGMPGGL